MSELMDDVRATFGPGWYLIGEALHDTLVEIDPDYRVGQVKEKFGGLVVYVDPSRPELGLALHEACAETLRFSHKVCELCGKPGKTRHTDGHPQGWLVTRCEDCPDRWDRR